jgi:hypothetical protein
MSVEQLRLRTVWVGAQFCSARASLEQHLVRGEVRWSGCRNELGKPVHAVCAGDEAGHRFRGEAAAPARTKKRVLDLRLALAAGMDDAADADSAWPRKLLDGKHALAPLRAAATSHLKPLNALVAPEGSALADPAHGIGISVDREQGFKV